MEATKINSYTKKYWEELLGGDWTLLLKELLKEDYSKRVIDFLQSKRIKTLDVFYPIKKCSLNNLKIIILTETPLTNGDYVRIKECIEREYHNGLMIDFDDSFNFLNNQSVLFLSKSLTIKEHLPQWNKFTTFLINRVCQTNLNVVFFIWDETLNVIKEETLKTHIVFSWSHPSSKPFQNWNCPNFKDVDNFFLKTNKDLIQWSDKI